MAKVPHKSTIIVIIGILFIFALFSHLTTPKRSILEVILANKSFFVDVADTNQVKEKGLSGQKTLAPDRGMFFVFDHPDKYAFWMKDMLFPIDILWIDENYKIVYIEKSILPETYPKDFSPTTPAYYVLEISAGQSDTLGLKTGDTIKIIKK